MGPPLIFAVCELPAQGWCRARHLIPPTVLFARDVGGGAAGVAIEREGNLQAVGIVGAADEAGCVFLCRKGSLDGS